MCELSFFVFFLPSAYAAYLNQLRYPVILVDPIQRFLGCRNMQVRLAWGSVDELFPNKHFTKSGIRSPQYVLGY